MEASGATKESSEDVWVIEKKGRPNIQPGVGESGGIWQTARGVSRIESCVFIGYSRPLTVKAGKQTLIVFRKNQSKNNSGFGMKLLRFRKIRI
jgi:hypothetical protein